MSTRPSAEQGERDGVLATFRTAFGSDAPTPEVLEPHLADGLEYWRYLKSVLHFDAAVVRPLERHGLQRGQSIVDLASGDGQLSLAFSLRGHRDLTLWDLDAKRLERADRIVRAVTDATGGGDVRPKTVHASATEFEGPFDVLACYQTLEHLSDRGNYSVASRSCQRAFLERVDAGVQQLAYFNAPNLLYPWDGHDTGKFAFHWLPITWRHALIERGWATCSWAGVAQPISVGFLTRRLHSFRLVSNYHAFDDALDYMANRPPYDYMGNPVAHLDLEHLSLSKRAIVRMSRLLGRHAQNALPVLSLILSKQSAG